MNNLPFPRGTTVPYEGNEHLRGKRIYGVPLPSWVGPNPPDEATNDFAVVLCERETQPRLAVRVLDIGPGVIDCQLTSPVPAGHLCYLVTRGSTRVQVAKDDL